MKELNPFLITKKYSWWHFWKKEERYTIAFDRAFCIYYQMNFRNIRPQFHYNIFVLVGYVDYNDYTVKYKEME